MKPWLTHVLLFKAVCSRKVVLKLNNKVSLSSTAAASNQVFFQRIQTKQNQKTHHFLFEKTHQPVCVCVFRASNVKAFIRLNHCSVVVISHREQQNGLVFRWKCCVLVLQAKFSLPLLPRDDVLGNWCTRQKCSAPSKANVKTMSAPDLCLLHISTSWLREESSHSISLRKLNELRYKTGQSSVSPNVYLYSLQTKCIIYYSHGLKTVRAHVLMLIKSLWIAWQPWETRTWILHMLDMHDVFRPATTLHENLVFKCHVQHEMQPEWNITCFILSTHKYFHCVQLSPRPSPLPTRGENHSNTRRIKQDLPTANSKWQGLSFWREFSWKTEQKSRSSN